MGKLIIGDNMKRKKKYTKNSFPKKNKYYYFFFFLFLITMSILAINNIFNIEKYFRDILFYPARLIPTASFIEDVNNEIEKENEELKSLLNIKESLSEYDIIYATVVERNNFYWLNTLVINKGSMDGVEEGLAVVDNSGLIGAISDVSNATSTVKLITLDDKYNSISVKVKGNDYELNKILKVKDGNLIIEGINKNINIQIGDKIVTNGLSNKFPSGITIGEVSMVNEDLYSISNIATVSLSANINNLRFVAILKRKI